MLENLTQSFSKAISRFRGPGRLRESEVQEGLREVRRALLEADVHFRVARDFTRRVGERLLGRERMKDVAGGSQVVHAFHQELVALMAGEEPSLPRNPRHPMVLLLAGLQGSGKTTTAAKLALWLRKRRNKRVLLAACDLQRPAAVDQLVTLARQLDVQVHAETPAAGLSPAAVAGRALERARTGRFDVLVVDTAGRLHVDEDLMEEIGEVAAALQPDATYLVLDSMTGQDAVESARVFAGRLPLYGVILTKLDGDARGGAALSVREITGCPIAFCGVGEQPGDLEEFQADRMASRILDLGDVVGLVEQAQEALDEEAAVADYSRVLQGKLTFEDLLGQFRMIRKMGSLKKVFGMLPGAGKMSGLLEQMDEGQMARMEAMVLSMTPIERLHPEVLDGSRRRRIARGSGNQVSDLNRLIRSLQEMQKQMKSYQRMLGGGRSKKRLIRQMTRGGRLPNLPRGFPGQSGR